MSEVRELDRLEAGSPLVFGGNRVVPVPAEIAEAFRAGDSVVVVEATEQVLHVPAREREIAEAAVGRAHEAFAVLRAAPDEQISRFYAGFADRLADEAIWARVKRVNDRDVEDARARGRSTTRLVASDKLRSGMIDGLRGWIDAPSRRGQVLETVTHDGWRAELVGDALGVVGFVFEGRPNVLADATGVLRGGNTVVFRIGSDALRTAQSIIDEALAPALEDAGLPAGAVSLVGSSAHAAGWALFSDTRLALAVARGSGPAVATLGALAQQAGVPVSLHGTGGAWLVAAESAPAETFAEAVYRSLDRKVCNTLNVCCIPRSRTDDLLPAFLGALERAGERLGQSYKLHVVEEDVAAVPGELFERDVSVNRAEGDVVERQAEAIEIDGLAVEWEWEQTPEVTLKLVADVDEAVALCNRYSPQFVASLISTDEREHAPLLRHDQRALRRRRLHALGRWAARPESARARPLELAVGSTVRSGRRAERRHRLYRAYARGRDERLMAAGASRSPRDMAAGEMRHPAQGQTVRGDELDAWLERTEDADPRVRMRATQHLCPCHTKQNVRAVWDRVIELSRDADVRVRSAAFHMMGDGSPGEYQDRIVEAIEAMYHDADPRLRRRVRKLLAHFRRTGRINVL